MTHKRLSGGLAALLLLALAACAAQSLPPGPGPTAPRLVAALPAPASVPQADKPETIEASAWEKSANNRDRAASSMPMPVSTTLRVRATGFSPDDSARTRTPPLSVNLTALPIRLSST